MNWADEGSPRGLRPREGEVHRTHDFHLAAWGPAFGIPVPPVPWALWSPRRLGSFSCLAKALHAYPEE